VATPPSSRRARRLKCRPSPKPRRLRRSPIVVDQTRHRRVTPRRKAQRLRAHRRMSRDSRCRLPSASSARRATSRRSQHRHHVRDHRSPALHGVQAIGSSGGRCSDLGAEVRLLGRRNIMEKGSRPVWDGEKWVRPGGNPQPLTPTNDAQPSNPAQPVPSAEPAGSSARLRTTISRHPLTSAAVCLSIGLVLAAAITGGHHHSADQRRERRA
jgi:hypothetical protein